MMMTRAWSLEMPLETTVPSYHSLTVVSVTLVVASAAFALMGSSMRMRWPCSPEPVLSGAVARRVPPWSLPQ